MKSKAVSMLHDATHRIPGVPAHDSARVATAPRTVGRHPGPKNRNAHHETPPRVLVAWQNWIGSLGRKR
jgi:hypothetical protein